MPTGNVGRRLISRHRTDPIVAGAIFLRTRAETTSSSSVLRQRSRGARADPAGLDGRIVGRPIQRWDTGTSGLILRDSPSITSYGTCPAAPTGVPQRLPNARCSDQKRSFWEE
jgi:hypothetical protein